MVRRTHSIAVEISSSFILHFGWLIQNVADADDNVVIYSKILFSFFLLFAARNATKDSKSQPINEKWLFLGAL